MSFRDALYAKHTDNVKLNRITVFCCYACFLLFGILGGFYYFLNFDLDVAMSPLVYYILLGLPAAVGTFVYKMDKTAVYLRVYVFLSLSFFYGYLLMYGTDHLHFIYAVIFLGMTVIYMDSLFSIFAGVIVLLMNIAVLVLQWGHLDETQRMQRIADVVFVAGIVFILRIFTGYAEDNKKSSTKALGKEQERFEALVSVGIRRIFEYDLAKDEFMTARSNQGKYGERRTYENFSENAKKYRYILYADWYLFDDFIKQCHSGELLITSQMRLRNKDADYIWYEIRGKTIYDEEGNPSKVIGVFENIDVHKREEIRHADENMRDPLTKLYKIDYTKELVDEFLAAQDKSEYAGMLIVDIDNFKIINDQMGKTFGDEILRNIAADLDGIFYPTDILGRASSDEVVILMKNIRDVADIELKIKEVQDVISQVYVGEYQNIGSTASVGAAVFPDDGTTYDELYESAEKALCYAKKSGANAYHFYEAKLINEYSKFEIDERHRERRKEEEEQRELQDTSSDSLIELAFKLIDESKDTDSAINLLIRQVTRKMGIGGVCIRTRKGKERIITCPYQYSIDGNLTDKGEEFKFSEEEWEEMVTSFDSVNGVRLVTDISDLQDEINRKIALVFGIRSFARCAFYDHGEFVGNVDFLNFGSPKEWSKEEVMTMKAVTNVISSYLMKMKAFEEASETVERLTGYDAVTGFYKYEKFLELVEEYLKTAPHGKYAMVYLDIRNFKYINETFGYETGDRILHEFAQQATSYKGYFLYGARVFSDNMVVLLALDGADAKMLSEEVEAISNEFASVVQDEYVGANVALDVGACIFDVDGSEILLKNIISNSNMARKEAKRPDRPNCVIYDDSMGEALKKEAFYINEMENAFKNNEFLVYLQPKVDLRLREVTSAEALIRWKRPDGTFIYPNEFIPAFERNKTITKVDYFVYEQVCKYLAERMEKGEKPISISVNVSRIHLLSIDNMVRYVKRLLEQYKIPPELLEFELTETVYMDKVEDTLRLMDELRKLGVKISMDDFGSGYSSLNILTKLPLDVLKLDRGFLIDFERDEHGRIIIPSIIDMAKKLSLKVVCEGVETKEQVEFLRDVNCNYAQGYFYSRPVSMEEFTQIVDNPEFVMNKDLGKN